MAFIIAVSNEKGGVAKTTTVLSLGAALAEGGYRILLIDLDPQANLTLALGYDPSTIKQVIGNALLRDELLTNSVQKTNIDKISVIPTNRHLEDTKQRLPGTMGYAARLRYAIRRADLRQYDFILIDCPPSVGVINLNALTAANLLIIPTQAEYFSSYALRNMMKLVHRVRNDYNKTLAYLILITMFDRRNWVHTNFYQQLVDTFGQGLLKTVIEVDTKLRESPIQGMPITLYQPDSRSALQYRRLAEEVLEYVEKTNRETRRSVIY